MGRQHLCALATVVASAAIAACQGDRTVSAPLGPGSAPAVRANAWQNTKGLNDTLVTTFKVQPNRALSQTLAGGHKIYFSKGAICDPATSGYGVDTWETACQRATRSVTITARSWLDSAGHPFVEFSPALRFNPDDERPVWLVLVDKKTAREEGITIGYCTENDNPASCVDESLTDSELVTFRDPKKGYLYRRIKHFSGYNITAGYSSSIE